METDENQVSIYLADPLSEVTRKERRMLLLTGLIGIAMVRANLIPQKISALDIDFTSTNQTAFLVGMTLIVGYFLAAFIIYAWSDLLIWRNRQAQFGLKLIRRANSVEFQKPKGIVVPGNEEDDKKKKKDIKSHLKYHLDLEQRILSDAGKITISRMIFEFFLPAAWGIIAIGELAYAILKQVRMIAA